MLSESMRLVALDWLFLTLYSAVALNPSSPAGFSIRMRNWFPTASTRVPSPARRPHIASLRGSVAVGAKPKVSEAAEAAFAKAPSMQDVVESMLSLDDMPPHPKRSMLGDTLLKARLRLARPWRSVKHGSVLTIPLGGVLPERSSRPSIPFVPAFKPPLPLCDVTLNLQKAAADPRISGVLLNIKPLQCGWGKVVEIVRGLKHFQQSGKFCVCYLEVMTEKEAVIAAACSESYMPSASYISLTGVSVKGDFLGDVLRKAGIEPQIQRIGAYKSAGDQIQRGNMSDAQREVLNALADDVYEGIVLLLSRLSVGNRSVEDARTMIDAGTSNADALAEGGWITGVKYMDEVERMLRERTLKPVGGMKKFLVTFRAKDKEAAIARIESERKVPSVTSERYARVPPKALGLKGKSTIAVLRVSGAISGRTSSRSSGISADSVIKEVRSLRKNRNVKAVVLRVDSPGGDALASDLMWRELRLLGEAKPLVASMSDVAGSGGYYISMPASKIVAEGLTITGSIGVVTGKLQLAELYRRIGFSKEFVSRGRLAEASADNRPFTEEEETWVKANAQRAYEEFRDKAALSRNMSTEDMQAVAQGRVWTGRQAMGAGLVDAIGGLWTAIALAKREAGIEGDVTVFEAGMRPARASNVVGAVVAGACDALMHAALGPDAALISGLSRKTPQALATSLDSRLVGKSAYIVDCSRSEHDSGMLL